MKYLRPIKSEDGPSRAAGGCGQLKWAWSRKFFARAYIQTPPPPPFKNPGYGPALVVKVLISEHPHNYFKCPITSSTMMFKLSINRSILLVWDVCFLEHPLYSQILGTTLAACLLGSLNSKRMLPGVTHRCNTCLELSSKCSISRHSSVDSTGYIIIISVTC